MAAMAVMRELERRRRPRTDPDPDPAPRSARPGGRGQRRWAVQSGGAGPMRRRGGDRGRPMRRGRVGGGVDAVAMATRAVAARPHGGSARARTGAVAVPGAVRAARGGRHRSSGPRQASRLPEQLGSAGGGGAAGRPGLGPPARAALPGPGAAWAGPAHPVCPWPDLLARTRPVLPLFVPFACPVGRDIFG